MITSESSKIANIVIMFFHVMYYVLFVTWKGCMATKKTLFEMLKQNRHSSELQELQILNILKYHETVILLMLNLRGDILFRFL